MASISTALKVLRADVRRFEEASLPLEPRLEAVRHLLERSAALGLRSAYLELRLAECLLETGDAEGAFEAACRGVKLDPPHPLGVNAFMRARQAMAERLRETCDDAASEVPARIYAALEAVGETDAECHVSLARQLLRRGDATAAAALLDRVLLLEPCHEEALAAASAAQRALGDEGAAREFELRATTMGPLEQLAATATGSLN